MAKETRLPNRTFLSLLGILAFFIGELGRADFLPSLRTPADSPERSDGKLENSPLFAAPNEKYPGFSLEILKQAPRGVHIAVGTERGFISASLSPSATHLLLTDSDLGIVKFNQINIALLKVSLSRQDYVKLRLSSAPSEWLQRARMTDSLSEREQKILGLPAFFDWWQQIHREKGLRAFEDFLVPPGGKKRYPLAFQDANYLWDEAQFSKIQEMARTDRIQSIWLDWLDRAHVYQVLQAIQDARLEVSVLDLSNAWEKRYIGISRLLKLLDSLREKMKNSSVLVLTLRSWVSELNLAGYGYLGITMDRLARDSYSVELLETFLQQHTPTSSNNNIYNCSVEEFARMNPY